MQRYSVRRVGSVCAAVVRGVWVEGTEEETEEEIGAVVSPRRDLA